jgi:2'-5' RNA ligase
MPHITLAYEDVTPQNIGAVMQMLAFERYDWEMWIDNLTMICSADATSETTGVTGAAIRRYPLRI